MRTLILFGNQSLNNNKFITSSSTSRNAPAQTITSNELSRGAGSVVTNTKPASKNIDLSGTMIAPSGVTIYDLITEYDRELDKPDRWLRFCRDYKEIDLLNATAGKTAGGDTANLTTNTTNWQYSIAGLQFDIDVDLAVGSAYVDIASTSIDLSDVDETGSFCFWLYIPSIGAITDLEFRIGNDSSNYWGQTSILANYEGQALAQGWNHIILNWSDMTETGTVTPSAIDYARVTINYGASQADSNGFILNGLLWINEDQTRNYKAFKQSFNRSEEHYDITEAKFDLSMFAYEGVAFETFSNQLFDSNVTSTGENQIDILGGSYEPVVDFNITVNSSTDLASIRIKNINTNKEITLLDSAIAISNSDNIRIDTGAKTVIRNGISLDFSGVFPSAQVGENNYRIKLNSSNLSLVTNDTADTERLTDTGGFVAGSVTAYQSWTPTISGTIYGVSGHGRIVTTGTPFTDPIIKVSLIDNGAIVEPSSPFAGTTTILGYITAKRDTGAYWFSLDDLSYSVASTNWYWLVFTLADNRHYDLYQTISNTSAYAGGKLFRNLILSATQDINFEVEVEPSPSWDIDWTANYKRRYL